MLQANPEAVALAGNTAVQAAVALLILKEVFAFVRSYRDKGSNGSNGSEARSKDLTNLLLQDDPETGAKRWNVKPYAREICTKIDDHEKISGDRHLRTRKTLDDHTEHLAAMRVTNDLLASVNRDQTEILRDLKNIIKNGKH